VETPAEEQVETPGEETVEETASEKPVVEAVATEASTLPAAYIRSAKARGWTDDEIVRFAKADPDLAMKTFERNHQSRTQEINEWAELGRKTRQAPSPGPAAQPAVTPAPRSTASALTPIDVQAMVDKFGNQELIEAIVGPVNAAIAAMAPIVEGATAAQTQAKQAASETLAKTVQDFFTGKAMKPYADAYGMALSSLTREQVDARSKVLETADALIAGAAFQGRQLSVDEALTLAHDSVSSGLKESVIRNKIQASVTKRAKGITLKPTAQGRAAAGGPPRDRQELLGRAEDRLAKAFR
jgi:hypothetical protein